MTLNLSVLTSSNCKILRRKCPLFGSKREKWVKAYQLFCEGIESLAERAKSGYRLDHRVASCLKERVKKISERTQVHSERNRLLDAFGRLEKNQASFDPFAMPPDEPNEIAIPQFKKGLWSKALQLLHFQGAIGWVTHHSAQHPASQSAAIGPVVPPLQEKLSHLRDAMNGAMEKPLAFKCPVKQPQSWRTTSEKQSFPIQTLEKELSSAVHEIRPSFSSMEKELGSYGNKHKNHVLMHRFLSLLNNDAEVAVLPSFGLTSDEVHAYLKQHAEQVYFHWNALKSLYSSHTGEHPFFAREDVAHHLSSIEQEIDHAFALAAEDPDTLLPKEMRKWLEEMGQKQERLMVRSTGSEDSHKLANAGGNTSKAYVKPTPADFCTAASEVIKSYFGKTSLQNRINAGMNPFEEDLLLAVTSEQLIGEPIGGAKNSEAIPISFVLFSNEPLYIGEEKFRAMRISASFGHGEGVVSEQGVAADTALILLSESRPDQLYILYNNQEKVERLAPMEFQDGQVFLAKVANPEDLVKSPALTQEMLSKLYRSGVLMEAFFGDHPTDIEGVIKNGEIFFVQGRPINRKPLLPTYLDLQKTPAALLSSSQAEILVPGRASVVTVVSREEILLAQTLEEAERIYGLATSNGQNRYKLIIVAKPEPENSHPVVNFSGLGVPCLYTSNPMGAEALLGQINEEHPLAVCMQTGKLILWDSRKAPVEEHIVEGFAVHPAKIAISLPVPEKLVPPLFDLSRGGIVERELKDLLVRIANGAGLEELERHPLLAKLRQERLTLEEKFHSMRFSPTALETRLEALKEIEKGIDRAIKEIRSHGSTRLERLLHIKALQTLLLGSETVHLGRYSLLDAEPLLAAAKEVCAYQEALNHRSELTDLLLNGAEAGPEAFTQWKGFLKKLEPHIERGTISKEDLLKFKEFISLLKQANALSTWLTFFQSQMAGSGIVDSIYRYFGLRLPAEVEELRSTRMTSESTALVREMIGEQQWVRQMESQLDHFADPKTFPTAWARLKEHAEKTYTSVECLQKIKDASPIAKAAAATTLERVVNLFDLAAKTLKSSSQFASDTIRLTYFKEMLHFYLVMTKEWALNLVDPNTIPTHARITHVQFFGQVTSLLAQMPVDDPAQLLPSRDFSVSAAMLGSDTAFERHLPQTCEDILTLDHQSKLTVITALGRELIGPEQIKNSHLPESIKQVLSQFEQNGRIQRVGMKVDPKGVVIQYNVPLRAHSGRIDLFYDFHKKIFTFTGKLLGQARERWPATKNWLESLERAGITNINGRILQTGQELVYSANVPVEDLPKTAEQYLVFADYSLDTSAEEVGTRLVRGLEADKIATFVSECLLNPDLIVQSSGGSAFLQLLAAKDGVAKAIPLIRRFGLVGSFQNPLRFLLEHSDSSVEPEIRLLIHDLMSSDEGAFISAYAPIPSERFDPYVLDLMSKKQSKRISEFFAERVKTGHLINEAIEFAQNQMKKPIELGTLKVLRALCEKNHEQKLAAEAANLGMRDPNLREESLEILSHLAINGYGAYIDISAAAMGMESSSFYIAQTLDLFVPSLLTREGGFETALRLAEKEISSPFFDVRRSAQALYLRLYSLGENRVLVTDSVTRRIHENEISNQLFLLVQEMQDALESNDINTTAVVGIYKHNPEVAYIALKLIYSQMTKGKFDSREALDLALSAYEERRNCYLPLFKTLIEQEVGLDRILKLAKDFSTKQLYRDAMKLFLLLVPKDVGIQEALSAVEGDFSKNKASFGDYLFLDDLESQDFIKSATRLGIEQVKQNRQKHHILEDVLNGRMTFGDRVFNEMIAAIESDFFNESSLAIFSLMSKHLQIMGFQDTRFMEPIRIAFLNQRTSLLNRLKNAGDPKTLIRILEFLDVLQIPDLFSSEVCKLTHHANEDVRRKAVSSVRIQIENYPLASYLAIQVAEKAIQDESTKEQGFELFHSLIAQRHGLSLAQEIVQSGLKDPNERVRRIAADIEKLLKVS